MTIASAASSSSSSLTPSPGDRPSTPLWPLLLIAALFSVAGTVALYCFKSRRRRYRTRAPSCMSPDTPSSEPPMSIGQAPGEPSEMASAVGKKPRLLSLKIASGRPTWNCSLVRKSTPNFFSPTPASARWPAASGSGKTIVRAPSPSHTRSETSVTFINPFQDPPQPIAWEFKQIEEAGAGPKAVVQGRTDYAPAMRQAHQPSLPTTPRTLYSKAEPGLSANWDLRSKSPRSAGNMAGATASDAESARKGSDFRASMIGRGDSYFWKKRSSAVSATG